MKLIKQLNEVARTSMSKDVFNRLVDEVISYYQEEMNRPNRRGEDPDLELREVIYNMIENIAGFEDTEDAVKLAEKVFAAVKKRLA